MKNIELILTIAIPLYSLVVILLGVWLGHFLTMKSFAHVQPSTKEMNKMMTKGVTNERDELEDAYNGIDPSQDPMYEEMFEKTGLPRDVLGDMTPAEFFKGKQNPEEFYGYDVNGISDIKPKKEPVNEY